MTGSAKIGVRYSPELGHFLVGDDEMTPYLFTPYENGVSTCYGGCATIWPPMLVNPLNDLEVPPNFVGTFDLTQRTDGTLQDHPETTEEPPK